MQMNNDECQMKLFPPSFNPNQISGNPLNSDCSRIERKWTNTSQYGYNNSDVIPSPPLLEQRVDNYQDQWQDQMNNHQINNSFIQDYNPNSQLVFSSNNYSDWSAEKVTPQYEDQFTGSKQTYMSGNYNNFTARSQLHQTDQMEWSKSTFPDVRSKVLTGNILHDLNECWDMEGEIGTGSFGGCEANCSNEISAGLLDDMDLSDLDNACMEQMEKQYYKEALLEVQSACAVLNISPDPQQWTPEESQKWISWTIYHCNLPQIDISAFCKPGLQLCALNEKQMHALAPHCGDILHARLDVWQAAFKRMMHPRDSLTEIGTQPSFGEQDTTNVISNKQNQTFQDDKFLKTKSKSKSKVRRNEEKTIHLWKFLIQLLQQPRNHQRAVRWLNQEQGVFKIEDSEELARLWGIRKNRPAMNYDKLSRSIRQYYKKGIIRKTEITRRLVYQFVLPII